LICYMVTQTVLRIILIQFQKETFKNKFAIHQNSSGKSFKQTIDHLFLSDLNIGWVIGNVAGIGTIFKSNITTFTPAGSP